MLRAPPCALDLSLSKEMEDEHHIVRGGKKLHHCLTVRFSLQEDGNTWRCDRNVTTAQASSQLRVASAAATDHQHAAVIMVNNLSFHTASAETRRVMTPITSIHVIETMHWRVLAC
jgi:hypothetical protein